MFHVVEFTKSAGGGLGLIRDEWLTPRKQESFWPPYKHTAKFNKCLIGGQQPGDNWDLFSVERIFYSTDDILKARQKIKNAESESELVTEVEEEGRNKRKRKLCRKLISSSSDESDYERSRKVPTSNQCASTSDSAIKILNLPNKPADIPTAICYNQKTVNVPNRALPEPSTEGSCIASELSFPKASSSKANLCTQLDDCEQFYENLRTPITRESTPRFNRINPTTSSQEFIGFDTIARHLAKIDKRLDHIQQTQKEILEKLCPNESVTFENLPPEIILPCKSVEDVDNLESWLLIEDNAKALGMNLSLLGGKKVSNAVRRILEKIFTNKLAINYNWTGKNQKKPLKDLIITKLIPGIVRKNRNTSSATNDEIYSNLTSWFRFTKDRDGGRDVRRKNKTV